MGGAATAGEIAETAQIANAHEFIKQMPDGYQTVVGERGMTLSGGQSQRIGIARAFNRNSPVPILDEPTAALAASALNRAATVRERNPKNTQLARNKL
jgi:ABC-type bacteriocin/lantibiotic exporter with double-glycine peptidase domain